MTKDEERSLVTRAKRGDTNAFEDIVLAYEKPVYNLALRYLRNPEDARDAVQETFLKSFTALQGFRGDSKLSVWLYRIAGNVCIDLLRARREAPSLTLDAESVEERTQLEIADERFDPAAVLERTDLRQRVRAAVELLPLASRCCCGNSAGSATRRSPRRFPLMRERSRPGSTAHGESSAPF